MEAHTFKDNNNNNKTLGLRYDHAQRDLYENFDKMLSDSIDEALSNGQIKRHGAGVFDTNARFAQAVTRCQIIDDNGTVITTGYSFCAGVSCGDQFRKDRGRGQSRRRAFSLLETEHGFNNGKSEQMGSAKSSKATAPKS